MFIVLSLASPAYSGEEFLRGQEGEGFRRGQELEQGEPGITPYGDNCPTCSKYGTCKEKLSFYESVHDLQAYFAKKGLDIGNITGGGRFLRVEVKRGEVLVDRVIFDRKTGRLRSVY